MIKSSAILLRWTAVKLAHMRYSTTKSRSETLFIELGPTVWNPRSAAMASRSRPAKGLPAKGPEPREEPRYEA